MYDITETKSVAALKQIIMQVKKPTLLRRVGLMPWAEVRLNTEANFETSIEEKKEDNRVSIPPFGWYRWANNKEGNPPMGDGDSLRLPPIRDGRKISYISFIITEEEMEEEKEIVTKKENEFKDESKTENIGKEKNKTGEGDREEVKEEEKNREEDWGEDIFSHSLAPSTFRLALASLPQGIEQTGRQSRSPSYHSKTNLLS